MYQKCLLAALVTMSLVGCASTPNISLDKTKTAPVNTVALLRVTESHQFLVRNFSGLPAVGGLIGGAIAATAESNRNAKFIEAYNTGSTRLSNSLVEDMQHEFSANGKQFSYLSDEFAKLKDKKDDYSHIHTDKDAILSVWFGPVGYVANGAIDAPYEPWIVLHVRMLDGKTKQVVSQKTYTAGYKMKTEGAIFVPCGMNYRFDTFDKLMSDTSTSIKALTECEKAIAQKAVQDLT